MIKKIKFFIKKLKIKQCEYDEIVSNANAFCEICESISSRVDTEYADCKGKGDITLMRFPKSETFYILVDMLEILNTVFNRNGVTILQNPNYEITVPSGSKITEKDLATPYGAVYKKEKKLQRKNYQKL